MAGIGGFGSFAGGFAQGFLPAMHQQQELQLERQRLQAQQQRELMAKADEQRKQMMDLIGETIAAEKAQNHDEKTIMSGPISKIIPVLERLTKSSGMDPSLIGPQIGMMIARPTAYDIAFGKKYGKQQQQLQQAQSQYAQASQDAFAGAMATDVSDPSRQATQGTATVPGVPFMGGQGQESANPALPPQVSSIVDSGQQQQQFQQQPSEDRGAYMERLGRALTYAHQTKDFGGEKVITFAMQQAAREESGKNVHLYAKRDGTGFYAYDSDTRKFTTIPNPDAGQNADDPEYQKALNTYEPLYGMPKPSPTQIKILQNASVTPAQFDFEAVQWAYGNTSLATNIGRNKAGQDYVRILKARATDYWMARGLKPEDANAAQLEFKAMAHGANHIAQIQSGMDVALNKAKATADVVKTISGQIKRTDYPAINEAILKWSEQTGDIKIPKFDIALETLAMNYAAALGMGNSVITDSRAQHARDLIKRAWSDGQINSAVDQLLLEMDREIGSTRRSLHSFFASSRTTSSGAAEEKPDSGSGDWQIEEIK